MSFCIGGMTARAVRPTVEARSRSRDETFAYVDDVYRR